MKLDVVIYTIALNYKLCLSHKSVAMRRRWVKPGKFEQNLETDLTILHPSEALSGRLRLIADFLGIATPVAVPIFELKSLRLIARFFTHFGHPRHNLR